MTGDQVLLTGKAATVRPAKGREKIQFTRQTDPRGDVHVVPEDARRLLTTGKLDRRLFNVSRLADTGYDDAARRELPLIVSRQAGAARATVAGARQTVDLPRLDASAVLAERNTTFWNSARTPSGTLASGIDKIWLDGPVRATLDHSVPQIGAPEAWKAGHTGKGAAVAVLDTGLDATHPDLAGAVTEAKDFTGSESGTDDKFGHGTHVASTVTGSGAAEGGKRVGVAPDANLVVGKVLNDGGSGAESWIIAGMEWAAAKAKVVNMSLGSSFPSDGTDPMSTALNRITEQTGALFVVSAGNSGPSEESLGSPGVADRALTVGAIDRTDGLADFSSRGPRIGDNAIKPDITAPGVDIVAAKAKDAEIGDPVGDKYLKLSGTSMAAPHVAGAAAIVAAQHPDWKVDQIKSALMASAKPNPALSVFQQGAGRVDVAAAVNAQVLASPASVSAGVARWPHHDDKPITSTVTYSNSGTAPVTVELTVDAKGPNGKPAPAGMFTVPKSVTVPAGGSTPITVTTSTVDGPDGVYSGQIVANGVAARISTPIAVTKEVESYDVKVSVLDHDGKPTPEYSVRFVADERPKAYFPHHDSGTVVARLPKGKYWLDGYVSTIRSPEDYSNTTVAEPEIAVNGDTELHFDARDGKKIDIAVERPTARLGDAQVGLDRTTSWGDTGSFTHMKDFEKYLIRPSKTVAPQRFEFSALGRLAEPDGNGGFANSPYLYNVRFNDTKGIPTELTRRFADRDLVPVRSEHAATAPGKFGMRDGMVTKPLPFTLDELYTPDQPMPGLFYQLDTPDGRQTAMLQTASPRAFGAGRPAVEQWNQAVFGPSFAPIKGSPVVYAGRESDRIWTALSLTADQDPNRAGRSAGTGRSQLYLNDTLIGESDQPDRGRFTVKPEEGAYRLHSELTRDAAVAGLSTKITADWRFRSSHVDGEKSLPLLGVRFAPAMDQNNTAPIGKFEVPVYVQRNGGLNKVETPSVRVSYDDGVTWLPVQLRQDGDRWIAALDHPAGAKAVSLTASTKDAEGNTVEQAIIRAYALR
ncbi:S8 family serine peptidase [Herbihabitans rhizosphaerae]|nr:S8 family serine peptidase [Herbihabitans rhizosphaerae]